MGYKTLVVDDDPRVLHAISRMLSRLPSVETVYTASTGADALQQLREEPDIALLFTDTDMFPMNGPTLIGEMVRLYNGERQAFSDDVQRRSH